MYRHLRCACRKVSGTRLERYSDRSRELLALIRQLDDADMIGDDLMHLDFIPDDVLFDTDGTISGVVD